MRLESLIQGVPLAAPLPAELGELEVTGADYDSRRIREGWLFFAFAGEKADGRSFAADALKRGAVAVVSELPAPEGFSGPWIQVSHGRRALATVSRALYGAPDERLRLTAVTGTNGKTTTVFAIDSMLRQLGFITGMAGTIHYRAGAEIRNAVNTTPESVDLIRLMDETLALNGTHFTFEASSHALALGRIHGLAVHTAVFTNLTQDHLDFHRGGMEEYFAAKHLLFEGAGGPPPRFAVINADCPWGRKIKAPKETSRITYGLQNGAEVRAVDVDCGFHGVRFTALHPGGRTPVESPLCGLFNVYNLLAAFASALTLGIDPRDAAAGLAACEAVPGRFERVDEGQPFLVLVDYAHTDDALRNVISAARALSPRRIITVFGCGGDRDRTKRPLMGQAAGELSDHVVVTSDNPRNEDPLTIINDILVGLRRTPAPHTIDPDRESAIRRAIGMAGPSDIVILAGKGHETYQVLPSGTIPFDDRVVARAILRDWGYRRSAPPEGGVRP
jgi:UDP-N-acetylmuramoyl-L-alanyl-D-glutamate--2,6-diaminopimelate ligase